ncbi:MAG TPA: hypothetical protein VH744_02980, partial [Terriglobales bacterium]
MKFLRVLCVLWGLLSTGFCLDRNAFTFTHYDLTAHIEPEQQRLAVRGRIRLRNDSSSPQKDISLQISSTLGWRSILLAGNPIQFLSQTYTSDVDHTGALSEAIVTLPQPAPPKGSVELEIGYEGTISLDTTRLTRIGVPKDTAAHTDWDQIGKSFTALRGIGYVVWYPVATEAASLSQGNDVFETLGRWKGRETDSEMSLRICQEYGQDSSRKIVSNGLEAGGRASGGGSGSEGGNTKNDPSSVCGDYKFQPVGLSVPTFAVADFAIMESPASRVYYFAEHKQLAEDYAQAAEKAVPFVSNWFGTPHSKAQIVELTGARDSPFDGGTTLLTPLDQVDPKLAEIAAVHQLTHAALHSSRPWIYEGLAHFAQAACRQRQDGRRAALDWLAAHAQTVIATENQLALE